jgi:ATP-dependent protease HslVU (ClpYQ) peptidase subunit
MASDMQATTNTSHLKLRATKLFVLKDGRIAGISGDHGAAHRLMDALNGGSKDQKFEDAHVIVMSPDGSLVEYCDNLTPIPVENQFYAIGTGRAAAMAAMHCGKTAEEAVEIAMLVDAFSGGGVMSMRA